MTTDTVKNAKLTTESVVNFVFFETLTTEKSATGRPNKMRSTGPDGYGPCICFISRLCLKSDDLFSTWIWFRS